MATAVETAVYRLQVEGQEQIDRATRSVEGLATAEDKLASANRTTSATIQRGIAQLDPLIAAQERYLKALKSIENAQLRGTASDSQIAARLALEKKRYDEASVAAEHYRRAQANAQLTPAKSAEASALVFAGGTTAEISKATTHMNQLGNATKLTRHEMLNMGYQLQDIGVQLAGGQNPILIGMQQIPQMMSVLAASGVSAGTAFKQIGATIGTFLINPLTLAVGVIGGVTAGVLLLANAWEKAGVARERAISGAGTRAGTTGSDIEAFVAKNTPSAMSGKTLTTTESRDLAEAMNKTGDIVISKLHVMNDAVLGFANQSKTSVREVIKVFEQLGKDPAKTMDEIEKTMGAFSQKTRDIVADAMKQGDATRAANAVIDEMSVKLQKAAANMTSAQEAGRGLRNLFGTLFSASAGTPLEQDLEKVRQKLSELYEEVSRMPPEFISPAMKQNLADTNKQFEELSRRQQDVLGSQVTAVFDDIAAKARVATDALIPQNEQIKIMEIRLRELREQEAIDPGGSPDRSAAITAQESMIAKTREAKEETARVVDEVNRIAAAHQGVSRAVALQLDDLKRQKDLAGAVGGAEKMAAQYAIDYAEAKRQGATSAEANAIASEKQAIAQAAINAAAKEQLFSLQNMAGVAAAVTGQERIQAQQQATINKLLHDGVSVEIAMAVAAQEAANAHASASAAVMQQVHALEQSTELIRAQGTGTEHLVVAAQAYENAIRSGASELAASALSSATIANELAKAAAAAMRIEQSRIDADMAAQNSADPYARAMASLRGHDMFAPSIMPSGPLTFSVDPRYPVSYRGGGMGKTLDVGGGLYALKQATGPTDLASLAAKTYEAEGVEAAIAQAKAQQYDVSKYGTGQFAALGEEIKPEDKYATIQQLYELKGGDKAANIAEEIAWLQSQPASIARDQQLKSLQQSIDSLASSTDSLNATNQELLSPYYTMDPRTSHIGFRSQGMAAGGYVDVPGGYSANDNMLAMVPVASGERIYVDPMTSRRGGAGGQNITINAPVAIYGSNANKDDIGRSVYQNAQAAARQIAMAGR